MSQLPTPLALALAALTLLRVCGSSEEEVDVTVAAEGAPATTAVAGEASGEAPEVQGGVIVIPPSEPAHGGTVVMAEDRPVEVVVGPGGEVEAYFRTPEGEAEAGPQTVLNIDLPGADGQPRTVPLVWQPEQRRYYTVVQGFQPQPGPVVVRVVRGGRTRVGRAPRVVVVPAATWRSPRRHRVVIHNGRWIHPSARNVNVHVRGGRPRPHPGRPNVNVHIHGGHPPPPPRPAVNVHIHGGAPPPPGVNVHVHGGGHGHPGRGRGVQIRSHGGHPGRGHGGGHGGGRGHGRH